VEDLKLKLSDLSVHGNEIEDVDDGIVFKIEPPNWFSIRVDNSILNDSKMKINLNDFKQEPIDLSVRVIPTKINVEWDFNGKEERN